MRPAIPSSPARSGAAMPRVPLRLALAAFLLAAGAFPAAAAENYRLAPGDQIRVVVAEAPQLSGTYTLSPEGRAALPVGEPVRLDGLTTDEAGEVIRAAAAKTYVEPTVAVEVAQLRPFFILGDVDRPGSYPTPMRLTALKAVALAGGYRRGTDPYGATVNTIRAAESLTVARRELLATRVRSARLQAEHAGQDGFRFEPGQGDDPAEAAELVKRETEIFSVRKAGLERQLALLAKEAAVRDDEIAALTGRIDATADQLELLRQEIATVQALVDKGLSQMARIYQLRREESQVLSVNLQTTVLLNQARQARNQLEIQTSSVTRDRRLEVLALIDEAAGAVDRLTRQLAADAAVIEKSADFAAGAADRVATTFRVLREDGSVAEDVADPGFRILPGDVVEVRRRLADALQN